jgi:hypothetical protein
MLDRKPRIGDRIGFGVFAGSGHGLVATVRDAAHPTHVVTRVGVEGASDANLCWIREVGAIDDPRFSSPFIWRFAEGLNRLAKVFP